MCWALKAGVLGQRLDIAIGQNARVGQFAPAFRGEGQHRADAALDIDPAVGAGRAGAEALGVELFLLLHQRKAERLQHGGALVKGHGAQLRPGTERP